ncbi:MAG TPA: GNAT family N-acetyltransferase [Bacteroidia bacterium]|nr:GNAT family N-acetyltransferase [Bacteroidia bacterium]
MQLHFSKPSEQDFKRVCDYIQAFELDDRELEKEQFCAAFDAHQLLGFGRLWQHEDCIELCSLGVIPSHRNTGIGKAITAMLIKQQQQPIYLVCIIPDFFSPFGFKEVTVYPPSIQQKLDYCRQSLPVAETYVAMRLR